MCRHMANCRNSLAPDKEWITFSACSDHLLDPDTPLRNQETIMYPSKDDPSVISAHALERKKRTTWKYHDSYAELNGNTKSDKNRTRICHRMSWPSPASWSMRTLFISMIDLVRRSIILLIFTGVISQGLCTVIMVHSVREYTGVSYLCGGCGRR